MSSAHGVGDVLGWLAASGLPGTLAEPPDGPLDRDGWSRLLDLARRHGLSGVLLNAVAAGDLPADQKQLDEASEANHDTVVTTLAAEQLIVHAADALETTDVPVRILGAPALAHLDYRDPSQRPFRAVRLLVRTAERPRVSLALGPVQRNGGAASITWQTSLAWNQSTLTNRYEALWPDDWTTLTLGGRTVLASPAVLRLVDACLMAGNHGGDHRLIRDRDIAQVLLTSEVDAEDVVRLAGGWRCEAQVAEAIDRSWARLRLVDALQLTAWATRFVRGRSRHDRAQPHGRRLARRA